MNLKATNCSHQKVKRHTMRLMFGKPSLSIHASHHFSQLASLATDVVPFDSVDSLPDRPSNTCTTCSDAHVCNWRRKGTLDMMLSPACVKYPKRVRFTFTSQNQTVVYLLLRGTTGCTPINDPKLHQRYRPANLKVCKVKWHRNWQIERYTPAVH